MDRAELYKYLSEKLNVYSGTVQEYTAEDNGKYSQRIIDVRWRGDVHFVFACASDGRGWYWVQRDGQQISATYWVRRFQEKDITYMQHLINDIENGRYHRKRTLREAIQREAEQRGLTSCMNKTKWEELFGEIKACPDISIQYKGLFDEEAPRCYWDICSDESIDYMNWTVIEWLKINPVATEVEYIGRLVDPRKAERDFSVEVEAFLKKHSIAYEWDEAEGVYVVYGWK